MGWVRVSVKVPVKALASRSTMGVLIVLGRLPERRLCPR